MYTFRELATHREVVARKIWALEAYNFSLGKPDLLPAAARLALGLQVRTGCKVGAALEHSRSGP